MLSENEELVTGPGAGFDGLSRYIRTCTRTRAGGGRGDGGGPPNRRGGIVAQSKDDKSFFSPPSSFHLSESFGLASTAVTRTGRGDPVASGFGETGRSAVACVIVAEDRGSRSVLLDLYFIPKIRSRCIICGRTFDGEGWPIRSITRADGRDRHRLSSAGRRHCGLDAAGTISSEMESIIDGATWEIRAQTSGAIRCNRRTNRSDCCGSKPSTRDSSHLRQIEAEEKEDAAPAVIASRVRVSHPRCKICELKRGKKKKRKRKKRRKRKKKKHKKGKELARITQRWGTIGRLIGRRPVATGARQPTLVASR